MKDETWICAKCGIAPTLRNTVFSYMGMTFAHEVLRCPVCGMVFIPRELADGKMAEVEQMMEDK
jgi:rubrerythrin